MAEGKENKTDIERSWKPKKEATIEFER